MKKKIISITTTLLIVGAIGVVLANNKAKINKAAKPVKEQSTIPVKAYTVKEDAFNTSFAINGTTTPNKEVKLASEVQGKLVNLFIKNGDQVQAGQVIATLDVGVYSAQLHSVESSIIKASLDIDRFTKLIDMGGATPMQLENAILQHRSFLAQKKEILEQMAHMQIRAPFIGKVENVAVEKGSFVSFGTVLAQLIDNSSLKINVYLSEQEAFKVKPGQPVTINSAVLAQPKSGSVTMVSDKADASGKFLTEISFNNAGKQKLKAGILADVFFPLQATTTGLAIPVSALVASAKQAKVFVVTGANVQERNIKTGIVTAGKIQVLEGLEAGEQVVISGQLNLENGTPISINQ
jgi:membrane fusion protein, multidrug efflux system